MEMLLFFGIVFINILISVWNCYAVGHTWKDVMAMGSGFEKMLLWSGAIQSGIGFSMPLLIALAFGASKLLTIPDAETGVPILTSEEANILLQGTFSLWYIPAIVLVIGTGIIIWAHSAREAYKRRDFASIAVFGWNSFAQISNMLSAVNNLGGAIGNVGTLFKESKGNLWFVGGAIVLLSLVGGFSLAFFLIRYFANTSTSRIEEYADSIRG